MKVSELLTEAKAKSAWDRLNKAAKEQFGEFGFATLESDDAATLVNIKKADAIAKKEFGETGLMVMHEDDMRKLINKHPELLKKSVSEGIKVADDNDEIPNEERVGWKDSTEVRLNIFAKLAGRTNGGQVWKPDVDAGMFPTVPLAKKGMKEIADQMGVKLLYVKSAKGPGAPEMIKIAASGPFKKVCDFFFKVGAVQGYPGRKFKSAADLKKFIKSSKYHLLRESDEHQILKAPSFGEMQKAIYAVVLPAFLKHQDKKTLAATDLTLAVLQDEAENDRFWTPAFDDAYSSLKKFCDGRKDIDYATDDIGTAMAEVAEKIYDYYSNSWNFAPGTKLPKLKMLDDIWDGDEVAELIYKLVPGAKEAEDAYNERQGTIDAMHKDFVKIANQQRMGKEGKAAIQPYLDAFDRIVYELQKKNAVVTNVYATEDSLEVGVRTKIFGPTSAEDKEGTLIAPSAVHVPALFTKCEGEHSNMSRAQEDGYLSYAFDWKETPSLPLRKLLSDELRKLLKTR